MYHAAGLSLLAKALYSQAHSLQPCQNIGWYTILGARFGSGRILMSPAEFEFMYREICAAILPVQGLAKTMDKWNEIARGLSESKRKRGRYAYR